MKHTECKDCELSPGDCGHHFEMDGVTNYAIASLCACDQYENCMFFKPKAKPDDLISREKLKKEMAIYFDTSPYFDHMIDVIDSAPAVYDNPYSDGREDGYIEGYEAAKRESERPQGEWIVAYHSCGDTYYFCSACKEGKAMDLASGDLTIKDFKRCPNCGAFMVKGGVE